MTTCATILIPLKLALKEANQNYTSHGEYIIVYRPVKTFGAGTSHILIRESLIIALLTFEKYFSLDRSTIFTGSGPSTL